jgi:hypothetical protein
MPPELDQWLQIPRLATFVVQTAWPYIVLPLDFILGLELIKRVMGAIRSLKAMD